MSAAAVSRRIACDFPKADIAHGVEERQPITSAYNFESHPVRQHRRLPHKLVDYLLNYRMDSALRGDRPTAWVLAKALLTV
jgi:hypothetical protein